MINRQALLSDIQGLLKHIEADLLDRSTSLEVPEIGQALRTRYAEAQSASRTALNFEDWRTDAITQAATVLAPAQVTALQQLQATQQAQAQLQAAMRNQFRNTGTASGPTPATSTPPPAKNGPGGG